MRIVGLIAVLLAGCSDYRLFGKHDEASSSTTSTREGPVTVTHETATTGEGDSGLSTEACVDMPAAREGAASDATCNDLGDIS